jgi:hypothetical protein
LHILKGLQYNYLPSILNQILISFYATAKNFLVVFCFSAGVVFFVAVSV